VCLFYALDFVLLVCFLKEDPQATTSSFFPLLTSLIYLDKNGSKIHLQEIHGSLFVCQIREKVVVHEA
jgi:hypothetical protein